MSARPASESMPGEARVYHSPPQEMRSRPRMPSRSPMCGAKALPWLSIALIVITTVGALFALKHGLKLYEDPTSDWDRMAGVALLFCSAAWGAAILGNFVYLGKKIFLKHQVPDNVKKEAAILTGISLLAPLFPIVCCFGGSFVETDDSDSSIS